MNAVTSVDADIIFKKITGSINHVIQYASEEVAFSSFKGAGRKQPAGALNKSSVNRMDFDNFILALSEIADLMYRPGDQAQNRKLRSFQMFFTNHLLPLDNALQMSEKSAISTVQGQIENLMDSLRDPHIVDILDSVHKSIYPYFLCYAEPRTQLLNLQGFSAFCRDFEIFPKILSKPKITRIFEALSAYYQRSLKMGAMNGKLDALGSQDIHAATPAAHRTPGPKLLQSSILEALGSLTPTQGNQQSSKLIDEHLFVESLALIALQIEHHDQRNHI